MVQDHQRLDKKGVSSTIATARPQRSKTFWGGASRWSDTSRAGEEYAADRLETARDRSLSSSFDVGRVGVLSGPRPIVQPKLRIARPGDRLEEEADRVADQVVPPAAPVAGPAREPAATFPTISRSIASAAPDPATVAPAAVQNVLSAPGERIEPEVRERMEERMGAEFDDVRVHAGGAASDSAASIGARAYTSGRHVVFGAGEYRPGTIEGDRLLAHELTHVVQQGSTSGVVQRQPDPKKKGQGGPDKKPLAPLQGDIPGERPSVFVRGRSDEIRIDADGDQHKELVITMTEVARPEGSSLSGYHWLEVVIRRVGSATTAQSILPVKLGTARGEFFITLRSITDGSGPTILNLTPDERPFLAVYPPKREGKNVRYELLVDNPSAKDIGGSREISNYKVDLVLPASGRKQEDVFQTQTNTTSFGISTLDVTIGAYKDRFRVVARPHGDGQLLMGISPVEDLKQVSPDEWKSPHTDPSRSAGDAGQTDHGSTQSGAQDEGKSEEPRQDDRTGGPASQTIESVNRGRGIILSFPRQPFDAGTGVSGEPLVRSIGITVVSNDGVSLGLDFDGDGQADVTLYDTLEVDGSDLRSKEIASQQFRTHTIRIKGPAVGGEKQIQFRKDFALAVMPVGTDISRADKYATSYTLASRTLVRQQAEGTYGDQVSQVDSFHRAVRAAAAKDKLITDRTYSAWVALDADLTKIRLQVSDPGNAAQEVDQTLVTRAAAEAKAFYDALSSETSGEIEIHGFSRTVSNNYTDSEELIPEGFGPVPEPSGSGPGLERSIAGKTPGHWAQAFREYEMLVSGLDLWISTKRMEKRDHVGYEERQRIDHERLMAERHRDLAEIAKIAGGEPKRILAAYYPDPDLSYEESEKLKGEREIPLYLYYWGDDEKWYLEDLSSPGAKHQYSVDRVAGETAPGGNLMKEMDDSYHYPDGIIQYSIPESVSGLVQLTKHVTWRDFVKWFQYAALGLAAVGLTLTGLGLEVPALWATVGSIIAQTTSSTIDLVGKSQSGELTATGALIDIGLIVSGIAGLTELAAGRIVMKGVSAAEAGAPLEGTMARYAVFANRIYLPVKATRIASDVITVATVNLEVAQQIDEINAGPGSPEEKRRAILITLTTAGLNTGIVALSIKGELPQFKAGRELHLYFPERNPVTHQPEGIPTAVLSGMESPANLKFSQTSISDRTSDGLTRKQLVKSIKKGWKGEPVDVVEWREGDLTSFDNRRLDAALEAGVTEIPVNYHQPNEPFPKKRAVELKLKKGKQIFEVNGELVVGRPKGFTGPPKYKGGDIPETWGEAVMFRAANQGKYLHGAEIGKPFPIKGSTERPLIKVTKEKAAQSSSTTGETGSAINEMTSETSGSTANSASKSEETSNPETELLNGKNDSSPTSEQDATGTHNGRGMQIGTQEANAISLSLSNASEVVVKRVEELKAAIPKGSQGRITMGVAVVEDENGVRSVLISTSEPKGYLRPGVTLKPGETIVPGTGHAEADIVNYAKSNNLKLVDIGATRPVCVPCQEVIAPTGAHISTPLKQ